jgi:hypothetical protein
MNGEQSATAEAGRGAAQEGSWVFSTSLDSS